jgi:hypothetical protein
MRKWMANRNRSRHLKALHNWCLKTRLQRLGYGVEHFEVGNFGDRSFGCSETCLPFSLFFFSFLFFKQALVQHLKTFTR